MHFIRTDSSHTGFVSLVRLLDKELAGYNGERDAFFSQYNKIDLIKNVVLLYDGSTPVACGAFKPFDADSVEIKRMYVSEDYRRKGLAASILSQLETWAGELGYAKTVLETGSFLPGTVALYQKCGYAIIPNYGQYIGVEGSVCMEKKV